MKQSDETKRSSNSSKGNGSKRSKDPLTRTFESNGPSVKLRGTAQHMADKYRKLAVGTRSAGDLITAESQLQHAEHYIRLIANHKNKDLNGLEANTDHYDDMINDVSGNVPGYANDFSSTQGFASDQAKTEKRRRNSNANGNKSAFGNRKRRRPGNNKTNNGENTGFWLRSSKRGRKPANESDNPTG